MNVQELIRDLQAMPNQLAPVRVTLSQVCILSEDIGDYEVELCDEDAIEADEVVHMGPFVLIRSK